MNQRDLAILLAQHTDTSQSLATASLYTAAAIITAALQHNEVVRIEHLGTFSSRWVPPRKMNPGGRGIRPIPGYWTVHFRAAPRLLKALRDHAAPPKLG